MYITVNHIIGEKRINLAYPIHSSKEVAVITMLSDSVQYQTIKPCTVIDSISPANEKLILSKMHAGRELISILEGMTLFTHFVDDERVIKMKIRWGGGIKKMIFNLNELDNTDNLEDGRPSNTSLTYHVTANEDFTHF